MCVCTILHNRQRNGTDMFFDASFHNQSIKSLFLPEYDIWHTGIILKQYMYYDRLRHDFPYGFESLLLLTMMRKIPAGYN